MRVLNLHTTMLTRVDSNMADLSLQTNTIDEGIKTLASRVDLDLATLDDRITHRRNECDWTTVELVVANGKIALLEEHVRSQRTALERLSACLDVLEDQLCHCGKEKGREVSEEIPPVLDSLFKFNSSLPKAQFSVKSFHSASESATKALPSSSSGKEKDLVIYDSNVSHLIEIVKEPVENVTPIPVPPPVLDTDSIAQLLSVHNQCAVRSKGPPKSSFHPYTHCCTIGVRSSTHRARSLCSHLSAGPCDSFTAGRVDGKGWGFEG